MTVRTFETRSGQKPIDDFIKAQDQSTISKIAFRIDLLERFGPRLGMPYSKKIADNLYELRIRGKVEIRILYVFKGDEAILLNIFKKKQDKISPKEIDLATQRLRSIE